MGDSRGVKGGAPNLSGRPKACLTLTKFSSDRIFVPFGAHLAGNTVHCQDGQPKKCMVLPSPVCDRLPEMAMVLLGVGVRAKGNVVVERFPDVAEFERRWRGTIGPPGESFPEVEVAENFLDGRVIFDQGNQTHLATALRTEERVNVPCLFDQFAPSAGGDFAAALYKNSR